MKSATQFYLDQLDILVGGTITQLAISRTSEDEFFGLVVALPDGSTRTVILLSDDEGNAPGSFEIHAD